MRRSWGSVWVLLVLGPPAVVGTGVFAPGIMILRLRAGDEGNQSLCLCRELNEWLWLSPASRWMLRGAN